MAGKKPGRKPNRPKQPQEQPKMEEKQPEQAELKEPQQEKPQPPAPERPEMAGATGYQNNVPVFRVRVSNVESPGHPIEFTIGPKTMKSTPEGRSFHLIDGGVYDLPVDLIQHLNGCAVPKMEWVFSTEPDIRTGEPRMGMISKRVGQLNRFSVTPVGWGGEFSPSSGHEQHTEPPRDGPLA